MFFYNMTITFSLFIAFLVINYNQRKERKKQLKKYPMYDL